MKLVQFAQNFAREEDGVTAIEYGLIAALIAVVIIVGVKATGQSLNAMFAAIAATVTANTPG